MMKLALLTSLLVVGADRAVLVVPAFGRGFVASQYEALCTDLRVGTDLHVGVVTTGEEQLIDPI